MALVDQEALQRACREVADENIGYLYVDKSLESVQTRYEEDAAVGMIGGLLANRITEEDLKNNLKKLKNDDTWEEVRVGTLYYRNPYKAPDAKVEEIDRILAEVFSSEPYVRKKDLRQKFDQEGFVITEEDMDHFVGVLADRQRVEHSNYGPEEYQKPGTKLIKEADIPSIPELLEREASNGTVRKSEIESALSMPVNNDILNDLQEADHIRSLDGRYLLVDDDCVKKFANSIVDDQFAARVSSEIEDEGGVVTEQIFEEILREQVADRTDALRVVDNSDQFLADVEAAVQGRISLEETMLEQNGVSTDLLIHPTARDRIVNEKARRVADTLLDSVTSWGTLQETRELDVEPQVKSLDLRPRREGPREYLRSEITDQAMDFLTEEVTQLKTPEEF